MTDFSINLDVRDYSSEAGGRYTNVDAIGAQKYSFTYIGGSDGEGDITEIIGSGESKITVTVNGHPRYEIVDCQFSNNNKNDLSSAISADKKSVVITDTDQDELDGYYKILIKDTNTPEALVWCDPSIKNRTGN